MEGRLEGHPPPCSRPHCGRERRSAWAPGGAKRGRALAELVGALGWIAVVAIILAILSLLAPGMAVVALLQLPFRSGQRTVPGSEAPHLRATSGISETVTTARDTQDPGEKLKGASHGERSGSASALVRGMPFAGFSASSADVPSDLSATRDEIVRESALARAATAIRPHTPPEVA